MPALGSLSLASLIDLNFILINRIFVLSLTLLFFAVVLLVRRTRGEEIPSTVTAPIKLSLLGFLLLTVEMALSGVPGYQRIIQGVQTIVVLMCVARLLIFLIVDVYLRMHTRSEVPSFLRDAVRLVVYILAAIMSLRLVFKVDVSAIVTTTTVLTAAIAFAMQNTLANALSGFSIQSDALLARQNWIAIKEKGIFGEIVNVGFRYTTLRGLDNTLTMVPNSVIMQNVVTYHGNREKESKPAVQIDVMLGYDMPPERAKELLLKVLLDEPEVLEEPVPIVRLLTLGESGITYQLKFWIQDPASRTPVQDVLYSQVWYAVVREGYSFPFPHRQIITGEARQPFEFSRGSIANLLRGSELFSILDEATTVMLADTVAVHVYGAGEVVVRQGETGSSLFIVLKGELAVDVDGTPVGSITQDSFFGEMSLLTGAPRSATVRAAREVWLAEITKDQLQPMLRDRPELLEQISAILAEREERTRVNLATQETAQAEVRAGDYLQRLRSFFKL